jgi:hypothetical protein
MVSIDAFRKLALSFTEIEELPHFEKTSFRVRKKIFATLSVTDKIACVKLSETDQDAFCLFNVNVMYPIPNKWGKMGWTYINLKTVKKEMLLDALVASYCEVAPKTLAASFMGKGLSEDH